jgi:hypothetical protein
MREKAFSSREPDRRSQFPSLVVLTLKAFALQASYDLSLEAITYNNEKVCFSLQNNKNNGISSFHYGISAFMEDYYAKILKVSYLFSCYNIPSHISYNLQYGRLQI